MYWLMFSPKTIVGIYIIYQLLMLILCTLKNSFLKNISKYYQNIWCNLKFRGNCFSEIGIKYVEIREYPNIRKYSIFEDLSDIKLV